MEHGFISETLRGWLQ